MADIYLQARRRLKCEGEIPRGFSAAIKKFQFTEWQSHRDAIHWDHDALVCGEDICRPHVENNGIIPHKRIGILVADAVIVAQLGETEILHHQLDDLPSDEIGIIFQYGNHAENPAFHKNDLFQNDLRVASFWRIPLHSGGLLIIYSIELSGHKHLTLKD